MVNKEAQGMSRRSFVAFGSALTGTLALSAVGCGTSGSESTTESAMESTTETAPSMLDTTPLEYDNINWNVCTVNCGSRCPIKSFVKDGTIVRISTDVDGGDEWGPGKAYQMRSCPRGRSNRERVYNPDRIQKPMRRVEGTLRGEGKYEEISWDDAITAIADSLKSIKEKYGNDAIFIMYGTGALGGSLAKSWAPDNTVFARLMNCWGGYLRHYCDYSTGQITWELPLFNGDAWSNNEVGDLTNSEQIVLFGNNPANTRMSGTAFVYQLAQAKASGNAKVICIDPMLSDTVIGIADEWIPIRPGTDHALVHGMAQYLFANDMLDTDYLRDHFVGFFSDTFLDEVNAADPSEGALGSFPGSNPKITEDMSYEAYLNGTGFYDGSGVKDPAWASRITGIPADKIMELAESYVNNVTCTIQGWGPQRHATGGDQARMIGFIAAVTKNVGISGGGTGARENNGGVGFAMPKHIPDLSEDNTVDVKVSFFDWFQAIRDYSVMSDLTWGLKLGDDSIPAVPGSLKLKSPIKFIWNYASNVMAGQHADINGSMQIYNMPDTDMSGVSMIVTLDNFMTPTAMMSDIILPGTTSFEEEDIASGGGGWGGFTVYEKPAVDPLFESKSVYEICTLLSEQLGVEEAFTEGRTQAEWCEWLYDQGIEAGDENLPATIDEFREMGLVKAFDSHEPSIAPDAPGTPTGKYEIFSKAAYNISMNWDLTDGGVYEDDGLHQVNGVPVWYSSFRGYDDPMREEYPFQVIGHHYKSRTHSSYGNVPVLDNASPQQAWLNTGDAMDLGINDGDMVEVYNEYGRTQLPARVTPRIVPGVISIPQGAWYKPESRDPESIGDPMTLDTGGCVQVLTSMRPTPLSKGNGTHSILANIKKA